MKKPTLILTLLALIAISLPTFIKWTGTASYQCRFGSEESKASCKHTELIGDKAELEAQKIESKIGRQLTTEEYHELFTDIANSYSRYPTNN